MTSTTWVSPTALTEAEPFWLTRLRAWARGPAPGVFVTQRIEAQQIAGNPRGADNGEPTCATCTSIGSRRPLRCRLRDSQFVALIIISPRFCSEGYDFAATCAACANPKNPPTGTGLGV